MCSSKSRLHQGANNIATTTEIKSTNHINGRPVLEPKSNQVHSLERQNSIKKKSPKAIPINPKSLAPSPLALPRVEIPVSNKTAKAGAKSLFPPNSPSYGSRTSLVRSPTKVAHNLENKSVSENSGRTVEQQAAGSIAAARRVQVAIMQEQRKSRIAHYGRTKNPGKIVPVPDSSAAAREEKRCSFITAHSDPIFIAYHDEEWGFPVHDDAMLFEMLVLTGAQVGSDWTTVLKKRQAFREGFAGFDAEIVAKFTEKKIASISSDYGFEIMLVRGVVDNSIRITEVKREFGSFDKYLWRFVNHKPICSQYKQWQKVPVKTSKSEAISKDMVKRGFRQVGPTVIHSFMQAAGLTNDHLVNCPRHIQCNALPSQSQCSQQPE